MATDTDQEMSTCPDCPVSVARTQCPECGVALSKIDELPRFMPRPPASHDLSLRPTFSLASLMVAVTLIGVLLGIGVADPVLGVLVALCAAPAWWRTTRMLPSRRARSRAANPALTLLMFAGSLSLAALIGLLVLSTFFLFAMSLFGLAATWLNYEAAFLLGTLCGLAAAVFVAVPLHRGLWRRGMP